MQDRMAAACLQPLGLARSRAVHCWRVSDQVAPWVAMLVSIAAFAWCMAHTAARPTDHSQGWWSWTDQGLYLKAAQAWSNGVLDSTAHWYFPGYALMAAAFVRLFPVDPFAPVNIICLGLSTVLFCNLATRLLVRPGATTLGALVWIITVPANSLALISWVEPWNTIPVATLALLSLVLVMHLIDGGGAWVAAGLGAAVGAVLLFRPTDAAILVASTGLFAGVVIVLRRDWRSAAAGLSSATLCAIVSLALYNAVYGWRTSYYLKWSALVGFEWRLLPLQWVTIVIDPEPLIPGEIGLARAFWWTVPGIVGGAACLAVTRGRALARHGAVLGAVALHLAVYLAYRDLHPQGLIRFHNYHYFRWVMPVLGLYAAGLVLVPWRQRRRRVGWGVAALAMLAFCWRAEFVSSGAPALFVDQYTLVMPDGLSDMRAAVRVTATGSFTALYQSEFDIIAGGLPWLTGLALKTEPVPGGVVLVPLRPLPSGPAELMFPAVMAVDPTVPPVMGRQEIQFDLPVHWWPQRAWERLKQRWAGRR